MILRFVGGCLRRLLVLALLVAGVALAWHYRAELRAQWSALRDAGPDADTSSSVVLADRAERKVASFSGDAPPERVALSQAEVQSLMQHRLAPLLPAYVDSPRVRLREGRVHVEARVPTGRFRALGPLREVIGFLPDTTELVASGQIIPVDGRRAALEVGGITAARIPLPDRLIPELLVLLGRPRESPLPADVVAVPLPPGVGAVYVSGDSLVLLGAARREGSARPTDRL